MGREGGGRGGPGRCAGEIAQPVKNWSNACQMLVKYWSNAVLGVVLERNSIPGYAGKFSLISDCILLNIG